MIPSLSCARVALSTGCALLLAAGCASDPGSSNTDTGTEAPGASAASERSTQDTTEAATTDRAADTTIAGTGSSDSSTDPDEGATEPVVGEPEVQAVEIASFDTPVDLAVRPADPSIYIVEQGGRIVRFRDGSSTVVADLTDRTRAGGEQGLLGLAFHDDGRKAYVNYTDADNGATVIAEYPVTDGALDTDAERVVLTVEQPFGNHNAGDLAIGPDGMLYIPLGDGGSGGDPNRVASDPSQLLGSLLRIDPTPSADRPYSIPPDNPFADGSFDGLTGAPEVWAWGLRNPWKIAFDPTNGDLWIADVGQNRFEEIDRVPAPDGVTAGRGVDFGWSGFEGTQRFNEDVPDTGRANMPVFTYEHIDGGRSISGGVPYRGTAIPGLAPAYVYSDFQVGTIWAFDPGTGRNLTLLEGLSGVTAVRAGPDGELYILEAGGSVHRLEPG